MQEEFITEYERRVVDSYKRDAENSRLSINNEIYSVINS
jgi:hypothetical protein